MFAKGDVVEVIDELISGVVTQITSQRVYIETQEGVELDFSPKELVKVQGPIPYHKAGVVAEKEERKSSFSSQKSKRTKKKVNPPMQVDLHIEQLVANPRLLTNYDMLNTQLEVAKKQLEFAKEKGISSIIFIHGVGEGVLKAELETLFSRYDYPYQDADYALYGLGATEVFLERIL